MKPMTLSLVLLGILASAGCSPQRVDEPRRKASVYIDDYARPRIDTRQYREKIGLHGGGGSATQPFLLYTMFQIRADEESLTRVIKKAKDSGKTPIGILLLMQYSAERTSLQEVVDRVRFVQKCARNAGAENDCDIIVYLFLTDKVYAK